MAKKSKGPRAGRDPSLAELIAGSGETPIDAVRAALAEEQIDQKFLGREFLTWLIYHADDENGGGEFSSDDLGGFRILPGERVTLKAMGEGAGEISAKGAAPAQTADVRYSIAGGLTVREAELFILLGERTWQFTVSAERFDIKRAKLPALLSENDTEMAGERLDLVDQLDTMLQVAYNAFLRERLRPAWETKQVPLIRTWLARSILEKRFLELEIGVAAAANTTTRPEDSPEEEANKRAGRPWKRPSTTQLN